MSQQNAPIIVNMAAAADLSTKQWYIVRQTAENAVNLASAATQKLMGTLQNKPKSGETAEIAVGGNVKVIAGGTVAINDPLTSDAAGKAIAATQTTAGAQPTSYVLGFARRAAVSNDIFEMEVAKFIY